MNNLQDQSRATCDQAVYTVNEQSDLLNCPEMRPGRMG